MCLVITQHNLPRHITTPKMVYSSRTAHSHHHPKKLQPKIPVAAYHIISVSVPSSKSGQPGTRGWGSFAFSAWSPKCHSVFLNSPRQFKLNGQSRTAVGKGGINPIPQRRANPPVSARRAISPSLGSFCLLSLFFGLLALALDLTGSLCCAVLACHVSFCDDAPNCRGPNRHSRWAVICRQKADRRTPNVDH